MSAEKVYRMTLFKIPKSEDQDKLLEIYKGMPEKALKNGKPYIEAVKAGKAAEDQRASGYTIAVFTTFASMEDFKFYDTECAAHEELKVFAKSVMQGNLMAFFNAAF